MKFRVFNSKYSFILPYFKVFFKSIYELKINNKTIQIQKKHYRKTAFKSFWVFTRIFSWILFISSLIKVLSKER